MEFLVRLKPFDARRGHVLRRFMFSGIRFHCDRGWYRVEKAVADYLRTVRQRAEDPQAPLAFDVCSEAEAKALEEKEKAESNARKNATDDIKLSVARTRPSGGTNVEAGTRSAAAPASQPAAAQPVAPVAAPTSTAPAAAGGAPSPPADLSAPPSVAAAHETAAAAGSEAPKDEKKKKEK